MMHRDSIILKDGLLTAGDEISIALKSLLVAEGGDGIDAGGVQGRDPAGEGGK